MAGTYKIVELVGTSPISFAEAIKAGIAEASKTIRHMDWFEVVEERGSIATGTSYDAGMPANRASGRCVVSL